MFAKSYLTLLLLTTAAHAEIITDGSLGPALEVSGPDYAISADLGRRQGNNLFHSFQAFSLEPATSVTFSGPATVENVISRVTGGTRSEIHGTLRSTLPAADIYLLNPAGIFFGPDSRLDVPGSLHTASADYLQLADGAEFHAALANESTLSSAAPAAFGFLSSNPNGVNAASDDLAVTEGNTLSLLGGAVEVAGGQLQAADGRINLIAMDGPGEAVLSADGVDTGSAVLDSVTLNSKANADVSGAGNGRIFVRGGALVMSDSQMSAKTQGAGSGGRIDIQADSVSLDNESRLDSSTAGTGAGATLHIQANTLEVSGGSVLYAGSEAAGRGGAVVLEAREVTFSGSGRLPFNTSRMVLRSQNSGAGGDLRIEADNITFSGGAGIDSSTANSGQGGNIVLQARDRVFFQGGNSTGAPVILKSRIFLTATGDSSGDAGALRIEAKEIVFTDKAFIDSRTNGSGQGGEVLLQAETIRFSEQAYISAHSDFPERDGEDGVRRPDTSALVGAGGNITLEALAENGSITLSNGAYLSSATSPGGNAGNITLLVGKSITLNNTDPTKSEPYITSGTQSLQGGQGGEINLETADLSLADGAYLSTATTGSAAGGNLNVTATGTVHLSGTDSDGWAAGLFATANPVIPFVQGGDGGEIHLRAGQLIVEDGAQIAASSIASALKRSGRGGNIVVEVNGDTVLRGVNPHGENEDGFGSGIYARSRGTADNAGDAGTIRLQTGTLTISDGAVIASNTDNHAAGGSVAVTAQDSVLISGDASGIPLQAPGASQAQYLAGFPATPAMYNQSAAGIYAGSDSSDPQAGAGGEISVQARTITVADSGRISTASLGGGDAGNITLDVSERLQVAQKGAVTTEAREAGGGRLIIRAGELLYATRGELTTSVRQSRGNGGDITVDAKFVVQDQSPVIARAYEGNGGNILITTKGIYQFKPVQTSPIDASSRFGVDGEVNIREPETDVSGQLVLPESEFIEEETLAHAACSAETAAQSSRFVNRPRPGVSVTGQNDYVSGYTVE